MPTNLTSDQRTLRDNQYADSGNLSARAALHERFSTNKTGWHVWVFDQFDLPANARILEVGAGPAWLWKHNAARIPSGWKITLSDFSSGMLDDTRANLQDLARSFTYRVCDVQGLPYEDTRFDAVIANHMLYHVPNIDDAIHEVYRVLKPGGLFYAATNGQKHMREIHELGRRIAPDLFEQFRAEFKANPFDLETGAARIEAVFPQVEKRLYEDALVVTEAEPLIAYVLSMAPDELKTEDRIAALRALIEHDMAATGATVITKDSGMFIARKN